MEGERTRRLRRHGRLFLLHTTTSVMALGRLPGVSLIVQLGLTAADRTCTALGARRAPAKI